tara:strand:- start:892 stop:1473 length:582 start_codon:yes stop_codon:yes gene_type:complete
MSTLETNLVQPSTGTTLTLGASGDTVDVPSGATLDVTGATVTGLSAGKILQIVEGSSSTQQDNSSTTLTDIGLSVAITPSSSSSKVLVMASFPVRFQKSSNYYANGMFALLRGSTVIIDRSGSNVQDFGVEAGALGSSSYVTLNVKMHMQILDSPSTTSATTYKVQSAAFASSTVNNMWNNQKGSIIAMEVSA